MWPLTGHEQVVGFLQRSLKKGNLAHAYLITGLPHVGKMTLATTLAQALNCEAQERPCGECYACRKIAAGNHPDVQIIKLWTVETAPDKKARAEIVIGQIEELQHWANLPPYEGKCRTFIFENAEQINPNAANRLLKTLEEPLPGVYFLLLTAVPEQLLETVISRCHVLSLKPLPSAKIEGMLRARGLEEGKATLLAHLAQGAPGWALAAAEDENLVTGRHERMNNLVDLLSQGYEERFEMAEELAGRGNQNRDATQATLNLWLELWRDLMLIKVGSPAAITNVDLGSKLGSLAGGLSLMDITTFINHLRQARRQLEQNVNARLLLEVLMLEMPRLTVRASHKS
jgi:DNA polymerase III subunit delta'